KAEGRDNWDKMDRVIGMVEEARAKGLSITANMYTYAASSTGLNAQIPSWAHEGGADALYKRLANPFTRPRIEGEMGAWRHDTKTVFVGFRTPQLRPLIGKTLKEVAASRGKDEVDTILDLVLEDRSRVQVVYFSMNESNVAKQLKRPWV